VCGAFARPLVTGPSFDPLETRQLQWLTAFLCRGGLEPFSPLLSRAGLSLEDMTVSGLTTAFDRLTKLQSELLLVTEVKKEKKDLGDKPTAASRKQAEEKAAASVAALDPLEMERRLLLSDLFELREEVDEHPDKMDGTQLAAFIPGPHGDFLRSIIQYRDDGKILCDKLAKHRQRREMLRDCEGASRGPRSSSVCLLTQADVTS